MKKRKLGTTGMEFSVIGFGTWALGGGGWGGSWGSQDDDDSIAAILRAVDKGVNWIDTAAVYGLGHSEEVVGRAVKQMREKPYVATKCASRWHENGEEFHSLKAESVREEVEASLRRLQVERIDLYQIHWPAPAEDIEEGWGEMVKAVEAGKVRCAAVCNFSVELLERLQPIHPVASLQPPYNMLRRGVEDELLGYCAEHEMGIVCYGPLSKGLLTGKWNAQRAASMDQDDHRRKDKRFQMPQLSVHVKLADGLKKVAEKTGHTPAQLAIAWVLRRPEVTAAIVGARRPEQVDENVRAGDWELTDEEITEVEALLKEHQQGLDALRAAKK